MAKPTFRYESVELSSFSSVSQLESPACDADQLPLGIRSVKKGVSWRDLLAILIEIGCLAVSIVIVVVKPIARQVGQISQLVVLGILLTIMGKAFQGRLSGLLLCTEVKSGARLQNLDAIIRSDALFEGISISTRAILLTIYLVPLALSASYKQFVGGTISYTLDNYDTLDFGLVGAPGLQKIGNGLGLMTNTSLPFFIEPKTNTAYGFNMYSSANSIMYFLDGPMPDSVSRIQQELQEAAVFQFDARVAGIVAYDVPIPQQMRQLDNSSAFLAAMKTGSISYHTNDVQLYPGIFSLMVQSMNFSDVYASVWHGTNASLNAQDPAGADKFGQNLRHIRTERRWCNATWSVSKSTAALLHAACEGQSNINQRLLQVNFLGFDGFDALINEFITMPVTGGKNNPQHVDLVVPAVGAAIWSRLTALDGLADGASVGADHLGYNMSMIKYRSQLSAVSISTPALRRHWALFLILLFYPIGTLVVVLVRATAFYDTAVDQNFGLMTLLAGSSPENQEILRGASLSGTATKPVPVRFIVKDAVDSGTSSGRITYHVGKVGQVGKIKKHVHYD